MSGEGGICGPGKADHGKEYENVRNGISQIPKREALETGPFAKMLPEKSGQSSGNQGPEVKNGSGYEKP